MKNSSFKTAARLLMGRVMIESENSDGSATVTTPKGTAKTPRASLQLRQLSATLIKPRPLILNDMSTILKRRALPTTASGDSVKVFIRVKPVMEDDLKHGRTKEALEICDKDSKRGITLPAANSKENWFSDFDGVLDDATNQEVFDAAIGGDLLRQFLSGINVSIMAYGQTGSGKTHTMFGSSEPDVQAHGLLHLVLDRIEEQVCLRSHRTRLSVSVFEVYNDELFSLLDVAGVEKRPLLKGMTDYNQHQPKQVDDAGEVVAPVLEALQLRARDATVRNATSSRSHAVVKLRLLQSPAAHDEPGVESTLFLVDLAGSESMSNASSSAQQCETIHINKSLQALERVVNSLSNCCVHVPYRDSLLTQVLQEGLSPHKARVALVATVSRFLADVNVTKSTLMFAQRARNIRTFAQVNVAPRRPPPTCPDEIYQQLQNLQASYNKLRQQLADSESSQERMQGRSSQHVEMMREEITRLMELQRELQRTSTLQQEQVEAALEAERAAHAATRAMLADAQRANGELTEAVSSAEAEARAAVRSVAELRPRLQEAQLHVVRLNGELAGAQSLGEQMVTQFRAAQEQLAGAREQMTTMKGQLAAAQARDEERQRAQQQQLEEVEAARLRNQLGAAAREQRLHELQDQLQEAQDEAAGLAEELAETREQLAALQRIIEDSNEMVAAAALRPATGQEVQCLVCGPEQDVVRQSGDVEGGGSASDGKQLDLVLQPSEWPVERGREELQPQADLQWESSDGAVVLMNRLEVVQEQLDECTDQLDECTDQLLASREQLKAETSARAEAEAQLEAMRTELEARMGRLKELEGELEAAAAAGVEAAALRQQLEAAARHAAVAAAAQEARAVAEAAAASRLLPLQTECERLRAMCALSEQQLARLQTECEQLRAEGGEAKEGLRRLALESERLREVAARAETEVAERQARLDAAVEKDAAQRVDAVLKQVQERVRSLEAERNRVDADHRGQLELKDKLIRQLENMNEKLQLEVTQLHQQDTTGTSMAATDQPGGVGSSPFARHVGQLQQQHSGSRSDAGASPGLRSSALGLGEDSPGIPTTSCSVTPSRTASAGGVYLLNRTITGSAAALARNNSRANALSTPPPAPRFVPSSLGPGTAVMTPPSTVPKAGGAMVSLPLLGAVEVEVHGLHTADSSPGPLDPSSTPLDVPPLDDEQVMLLRVRDRSSPELKLMTEAVRNVMNY